MSSRTRAWILIAAAVVAGVFGAARLRIVTDIRHFIPASLDSGLSKISAQLATSPLTRMSTLALRGEGAPEAAPGFRQCLDDSPLVEWSRGGIDPELEEATYDLFFPRRFYLPAPTDLPKAAVRLKRTLGGPKGSFIRPLAPKDPLLLYPDFLEGLRGEQSLRVQAGQFVTADGSAAIVFLRTRDSAFDAEGQRAFQTLVASCLERHQPAGASLELLQSGIGRFAMLAESQTKADVSRVSIASTVAIIATFLILFGRIRIIVLAFAPVAIGFAFGLGGTALVSPDLHGLSLAFGSALMGVGVDYAIHLIFHLDRAGGQPISEVVRRVRPGLGLGAATTAVGLAGMALTTFPGMRELALLGAIGIGGSLAATLLVIPPFVGALPGRRIRDHLVRSCGRLLGWIETRGHRMIAVLVGLVLAGALGASNLEWSDGLRVLYQTDDAMLAEDAEVRELTGAAPLSRMVLAHGASLEEALERNDRVHDTLSEGVGAGELEGFRSVHTWLPSRATQTARLEHLRSEELQGKMRAAFAEEGFVAKAFGPYFEELAAPSDPLALEHFEGTPFEAIVTPFILDADEGVVVVSWLRGQPSEALMHRLEDIPGVQLFDQQRFLDDAYQRYRAEMVRMLGAGLVAVGLVVLVWYRSWRVAVAASLPAVAGACGALAAAAWIDSSANLVHAASLLLICSIGADYGVFMVEFRDDPEQRAVTLAGATASALTTALSFGLLAMSDNPALASVGRSVVVGVVCALVTSPAAILFNPSHRR